MIMNKVTDKSWLEKGFWYRSYDGNISQNECERYQVNSEYVKTIASDVLELIEVDDLVRLDDEYFGQEWVVVQKHFNLNDDVIEIWTKTTSNHYTRQWTKKDGLKPNCIKL